MPCVLAAFIPFISAWAGRPLPVGVHPLRATGLLLASVLLASTASAADTMTLTVSGLVVEQTQTEIQMRTYDIISGTAMNHTWFTAPVIDGVATFEVPLPHQAGMAIVPQRVASRYDLLGMTLPLSFYGLAQRSWLDVELTSIVPHSPSTHRWNVTFSADGVAPVDDGYFLPWAEPGDLNDDGRRVNGRDFLTWQRAYGTDTPVLPHQPRYGTIGTVDRLREWEEYFPWDVRFDGPMEFDLVPPAGVVAGGAVPEPGSVGLAVVCAIVLFTIERRALPFRRDFASSRRHTRRATG